MMTDDIALLRKYARHNSEAAFSTLVSRHVNLVYSVALQEVHDPHLAEEITQAVFIILARKAKTLNAKTILSGWLCRTARYASANALTIQRRRQHREQEAHMQSILNEPESDAWTQIAPLLGGAMKQLGQKDHDAVVLRFFEGKSFQEIGTAFGASENAAKKRVAYALEKLRRYFSKRGIASTTATLAGAISANSVQAAPVALAKTAAAVALTNGAAAGTATLTLVKGALKMMAWANAKIGIIIGMCILLAFGTIYLADKESQNHIQARYEYEADGMFEGEEHLLFGNVKKWDPVSFKLYVKDDHWLIRMQDVPMVKYIEIGFDGKTMYRSGLLDEKAYANLGLAHCPWEGDISYQSVPFFGPEPHIPIIWLALASSRYLDGAKDHLLPPYSREPVRVRLPASVIRMNDLPRLPQKITFFDDGFDRSEGVAKKRHPPYDKDFTSAIYTVNTFTNVGGYSLPLTFNLKVFVPAYSGSGVTLMEEYNGTVNHVSTECSLTDFVPEVPRGGNISDTRFVSIDAIRESQFIYKTNRWLSRNEVEALPGFSNYVVMEHAMKNISPVYVTHEMPSPATLTP